MCIPLEPLLIIGAAIMLDRAVIRACCPAIAQAFAWGLAYQEGSK